MRLWFRVKVPLKKTAVGISLSEPEGAEAPILRRYFFAFFMATYDIQSLWDEFNKILGLIFGSLGGVFLLGMVTQKANGKGAIIGLSISFLIQILISYFQSVHLLL